MSEKIFASDGNRTSHDKRCVVAALALCLVHILSVSGMAYQVPLTDGYDQLVGFLLWLSPVLVLLLFRKACVLIGIFAIPISVIFLARAYYAWQFFLQGINSVGQKGDWAWWLTTLIGVFAVAVVALWLLFRISKLVDDLVGRARGSVRD